MRILKIILLALLISSCDQFDEEAHAKECGTSWLEPDSDFARYKFLCPYTVHPVQQIYSVGDTVTVTCQMSDTIYCESSKRDYYIPDFPFRSAFTIWYFPDGGEVLSGLRHTTWKLDSLITDRKYNTNPLGISDHIAFRYYGQGPGTGPGYYFQVEVVLDTVGVFMFEAIDQLEENDINGRYTNGYDFECQLPWEPLGYYVQNRLTHEDHLDDYDEEIQRIVDEAYEGKSGFDAGGYKWRMRRAAGYAFEVR